MSVEVSMSCMHRSLLHENRPNMVTLWNGKVYYMGQPRASYYPRLTTILKKLFLCVSFYRLLRFSWLSCPSFLKSVCYCRIKNYRHQRVRPYFPVLLHFPASYSAHHFAGIHHGNDAERNHQRG